VIADAMDPTKDLNKARGRIGELLHTLQDFYSHSNWVEMGQTTINHRIGIEENIGPLAQRNQSTCTSQGCRKIKSSCVNEFLSSG
jgi:von Willebrand factor A domain-containing protein 7